MQWIAKRYPLKLVLYWAGMFVLALVADAWVEGVRLSVVSLME
jgi:hypothetical protein